MNKQTKNTDLYFVGVMQQTGSSPSPKHDIALKGTIESSNGGQDLGDLVASHKQRSRDLTQSGEGRHYVGISSENKAGEYSVRYVPGLTTPKKPAGNGW